MASTSSSAPKAVSSETSHVTLLRPRHSAATESIPYDMAFLRSSLEIDREKWRDRKDFFCTTLSFCLSLANLWRFPRQAYMFGQGTFVLLYILFTILFGSSLLFFEVALGQYSTRGFARVFSACPLIEGLSYSMCLYCAVSSVVYNFINSVSFVYIFASMQSTLEYSVCNRSEEISTPCNPNSSIESHWPEFVFYNETMWVRDQYFSAAYSANWRNIGVLFFLWLLIGISIVAGIRTNPWPCIIHCVVLIVVLVATLIITLTMSGSIDGLSKFFTPTDSIYELKTWAYAFEQMVVTLGLGMGPLINFASFLTIECPIHKDTALLCFIVLINSLLVGLIFFCTLGVIAHTKNVPVDVIFVSNGGSPPVHAVFSHIFTKFPDIVAQSLSFIFFLTFFLTGWFSLIHYTETIATGIYESVFFRYKFKVTFNISICIILFLVGVLCETLVEYRDIIYGAEYFIGISVLIILLLELITIIYIYGVFHFCDEVQFMLGVYPNSYYQITWIAGPIVLLLLVIFFMYILIAYKINFFHLTFLCVFIIGPVLVKALYNVIVFQKKGILSQILYPRYASFDSTVSEIER